MTGGSDFYFGTITHRSDTAINLRLADGVELEILTADIIAASDMGKTDQSAETCIHVTPGAKLRAVWTSGAAKLDVSSPNPLPLIAYEQGSASEVSLIPGSLEREWMDSTPGRFAYRCLPLLIANQSGWVVLNTYGFSAQWTGGLGKDAIEIEFFEKVPGRTQYVTSHFGSGVLTFSLPYLFRTPPGYNIHVRGPANMPKDGITALEGIVETDWSDSTFTMNWKFTRANHRITFSDDEPIAMFSPIRRGDVERFKPVFRNLATSPDTEAGFLAFTQSRLQFNKDLEHLDKKAFKHSWQRHYMRGETVLGRKATEHQTSITLGRFEEEE